MRQITEEGWITPLDGSSCFTRFDE